MNPLLNDLSVLSGIPSYLLAIVLIWSLFWKGLALWKSAQKQSKIWFVAILLINTIGILEILYIFLFSKLKLEDSKKSKVKKTKSANSKAFLR